MGIFDGCLLACDVDGTLVESGYINPKNIEKINYFVSQGGYFAIATGRGVSGVSDVTNAIKSLALSVVTNGCMIYDYQNKKTVFERNIDQDDYHFANDVVNCGFNVGIEIHAQDRVLTLARTQETDDHQIYEKMETTVMDFNKCSRFKWNKVIYLLESEAEYVVLENLFENCEKNCRIVRTCAVIDGRQRNYLEQIPLGVSKQNGIEKLCEILGIKSGNVFAIGDYYNDVEMLKNSDISAATFGAPDEIKQMVDFVGSNCEDGAVADFIDYLTKIKNTN